VLDDSLLAAKVKYALVENKETSGGKINVEIRDAIVELSGFVDSYEERDAAVDMVSGIDGVKDVINSIDINQ
jgi:hyperosmotically inducible protein